MTETHFQKALATLIGAELLRSVSSNPVKDATEVMNRDASDPHRQLWVSLAQIADQFYDKKLDGQYHAGRRHGWSSAMDAVSDYIAKHSEKED